MRTRVLFVVAGMILTLGVAEASLRIIDDRLPAGTDWPTVETDVKFHRLEEVSEADVVFLGSSMTEAGIDPIAFADESMLDSAFNSGFPYSTPFSNEWWLNHVVLPEIDPKLVVIGLPAWSGGAGAKGDFLLARFGSVSESAPESRLALLEYAGVFAEWDSRESDAKLTTLITDRGHQTGYYDRSIDNATPLDLPFGPPTMPADEAEAVTRMVELLAERGIESMVLIEPGRYPGDDGTVDYDRYIDSIMSHEAEWGVPIVDAFHQEWDRAWFADLAHFNRRGTEEFTAFMARTIDGLWVDQSGQPGQNPADIA